MPFFQNPVSPPRLPAIDTIDIWRLSLDKDYPVARFLTSREQERAGRFYFERHTRRFRQAHGQLRLLLAGYTGEDPKRIQFDYGPHGKPCLPASNLHFNLSHSGERALVAIGNQYDVGIDIEQFSSRPFTGIARQMFSKQELAQLADCPACLRAHVFFNIWSQKEAFIKACGLGLHYPTKNFDVLGTESQSYIVHDNLHNLNWRMQAFYSQPGFASALCCHPDCKHINFNEFDPVAYLQCNYSPSF